MIAKLIDAILLAWTKCLPPPYGDGSFSAVVDKQTDCNRFTALVGELFIGYKNFSGLTANQITAYLAIHPAEWLEIPDGSTAQFHVNNGAWAVCAWANPDPAQHGHVDVIRPGVAEPSAKWNVTTPSVPKVANVGEPAFCKIDAKASFAFGPDRRPKYYVYKPSINEAASEKRV